MTKYIYLSICLCVAYISMTISGVYAVEDSFSKVITLNDSSLSGFTGTIIERQLSFRDDEVQKMIPSDTVSVANMKLQVLDMMNQSRSSYKAQKLVTNDAIALVAQKYAEYLGKNNMISHYGASGEDAGARLTGAGVAFSYRGETLGQSLDASGIVQLWLDSPRHRVVMLDDKYNQVGLGMYRGVRVAVYYYQKPIVTTTKTVSKLKITTIYKTTYKRSTCKTKTGKKYQCKIKVVTKICKDTTNSKTYSCK